MGSEQVLTAVLARCRAALRLDGIQVLAGHGVADTAYRPPHLPYASVTGPLCLETESERDTAARVVRVQNPGYVAGVPRQSGDLVPGVGALRLVLDGTASGEVAVDLTPLTGTSFTGVAGGQSVGAQVAARLQAAVRAAVDAGAFTEAGAPVTDAERLRELRAVTVRWDRVLSRVVVASGRRGPLPGVVAPGVHSAVRLATPSAAPDLADSLGLGDGALVASGRLTRSRDAAPTAVAIDVRLDLWGGTQAELAGLLDAWSAVTPLRAEVLLAPTLLADDVNPGDTSVHLLHDAAFPTPATLLAATAAGGFSDRLTGRLPLLDGAVAGAEGLETSGAATATFLVAPARPVPDAWHPRPAGAHGWAVELDLRVLPGGQDGDTARVLRLSHGARTALRLDVSLEPAAGSSRYMLTGAADHIDGTPFGAAAVSVDGAALEGGPLPVTVLVDASSGAVRVLVEGGRSETEPTPAPGPVPNGTDEDLLLVLGDPGGADLDLRIGQVAVHGRPLGPADPRQRTRGPSSVTWVTGDPLFLGRSRDGFTTTPPKFGGHVLAVEGDVLRLDRPVPEAFPRGASLAHQGALFFAQRQFRRNDDLMNRLYRVALEYRVSAFLDDTAAAVTAPLVEIPEVDVRELARLLAEQADPEAPDLPPRPAAASVGVTAVISDLPAIRSPRTGAGSSGPGPSEP